MADEEPKAPDEPVDPEKAAQAENRKFNRQQEAKFEEAIYGVITGAMERAKNSVTVIQAASTALLGIYTGLLGFVYSATGEPLPLRAIVAPVFFGLAVLLSTYYTSFISPRLSTGPSGAYLPTSGAPEKRVGERINSLVAYVGDLTTRRAWALRAAVAALAVGLATVALPFISDLPFIGTSDTKSDDVATSASAEVESESTEWISADLPTALPPSELPRDLARLYFKAQITEALAKAEAAREAQEGASCPTHEDSPCEAAKKSAELDSATGWIIGLGMFVVLLFALPGLIESFRQWVIERRARRAAAASPASID